MIVIAWRTKKQAPKRYRSKHRSQTFSNSQVEDAIRNWHKTNLLDFGIVEKDLDYDEGPSSGTRTEHNSFVLSNGDNISASDHESAAGEALELIGGITEWPDPTYSRWHSPCTLFVLRHGVVRMESHEHGIYLEFVEKPTPAQLRTIRAEHKAWSESGPVPIVYEIPANIYNVERGEAKTWSEFVRKMSGFYE